MFELNEVSHRRLNPLTGEWVLVSPHRTDRPWQGQVEKQSREQIAAYAPSCYLCPGNERAGGARNPQYSSIFVFDNDFSALQREVPQEGSTVPQFDVSNNDFLLAKPERGICRVGCFSPRHDLALASMSAEEVESVVDMWSEQFKELSAIDFVRYVQIFENRGALMGASNPHPHCQMWATESIPNEPAKEQRELKSYFAKHNRCLLCDYLEYEVGRERLIYQNAGFAVVTPFWAVWPFETMIISRRHLPDLAHLNEQSKKELAQTLQQITRCYDRLFDAPFPYSMGFHQQPTDDGQHREWHLHGHFYPPLLRSATIRKFMVGFEMLGSPQRDITAESAAGKLRGICETL
jgi:UDPglucose--hexose-1-phosphate uridylyltransferase